MTYDSLKIDQLASVYDMLSLKGKKAIVTGAAGGIGRSTACALAELGADVALMDIEPKREVLEYNANFIADKYKVKTLALTGNVGDPASVDAFMGELREKFGTLDIAHSNAGIAGGTDMGSDIDIDLWNRMVDINLTGMLLVGRAAANIMKQDGPGGSVIFTASMSGSIVNKKEQVGARYAPGYTATKAGVIQLARSMAMDYVEQHIRFNTISPGIILSGLHDGWDHSIMDEAARMIPMRRFGSLNEIMGIVGFLASDLSSYITGADFMVDGGYTVW